MRGKNEETQEIWCLVFGVFFLVPSFNGGSHLHKEKEYSCLHKLWAKQTNVWLCQRQQKAEEMAQLFGALAALVEDSALVPSTHKVVTMCNSHFQGDMMPSPGLQEYCMHVVHIPKQANTHTH